MSLAGALFVAAGKQRGSTEACLKRKKSAETELLDAASEPTPKHHKGDGQGSAEACLKRQRGSETELLDVASEAPPKRRRGDREYLSTDLLDRASIPL